MLVLKFNKLFDKKMTKSILLRYTQYVEEVVKDKVLIDFLT